jgi:putative glutamine amidotransferase
MRKPRIGIVSDLREVDVGAWRRLPAVLVPATYINAVVTAGGLPVVIPPQDSEAEEVDLLLEGIDGLLLIGGRDLDPSLYADEAHPRTDRVDELSRIRDSFERLVLDTALAAELPTLGICRGVQLLNVALGGDLVQDLGEAAAAGGHQRTPGAFAEHFVSPQPESTTASVLGEAPVEVFSYHHQGIGRVAPSLQVAARSSDGMVEALEDGDRHFCVGVLWHPEERVPGNGLSLFSALVKAATDRTGAAGVGGQVGPDPEVGP